MFLAGILFFCMGVISAQTNQENFSSEQQQRFKKMTEELRCLVCQNENLWDSQAPLAKDLRTEIYNKIKQGESDELIKQYLVARYGQFILFKPALNKATYLLWILPFVFLLGGFFVVLFWVRRKR